MVEIVGIRFKNGGKLYYFAPNAGETYEAGMGVIVETARGLEYAEVAFAKREIPEEELVSPLKPIVRIASRKDAEQAERNEARKPEAMRICREKIKKHGLEMKLIDCEFTFDGSKVVFYFTADGRVDFRELVKDLAAIFHIRIELRQVGIRDETRILGGIAPCGRVCCCAGALPDFKKVSIKMAKNQGLSLNPGKISGLCGRLMCCLGYENYYYAEAYKKMPKIGAEADFAGGKGTVVSTNMLKMEVRLKIETKDGLCYKDFPVDQIRFRKSGKQEKEESVPDQEIQKILD